MKNSEDDESSALVLKSKPEENVKVPLCVSYRLLITFLCMLAMLLCFANQSSMGSTMVCMTGAAINETHVTNSSEAANGTVNDNLPPYRYSWDKKTQGFIHSSLFVGYYLTQIPSGILATRYGGRRVAIVGLFFASLAQILTPFAANQGIIWLCVVRAACGFASGFVYAPIFGVLANWVPAPESSLLFGIAGTGMELGSVVVFTTSAFVCDSGVIGGWPLVYYGTGCLGMLTTLAFCIIVSDLPSQNRWISGKECGFIETAVEEAGGHGAKEEDDDTPLTTEIPVRQILTSPAVWAVVVAQIGSDWLYYFYITVMPSFMQEVMKMKHTMITLLTGLPFLAIIPAIYVTGTGADYLRRKKIMSTTAVRKAGDFICKIFPGAILVGLGFLGPDQKLEFILLYAFSALLLSFIYISWLTNPVDLAPAYTGFIACVCETGSMWIAIIVPIMVENMTVHKTVEEWRIVLYISGALQVATFLFYLAFGSAVLQPWATPITASVNVTDEEEDKERESRDEFAADVKPLVGPRPRSGSRKWKPNIAYESDSEIGPMRMYRSVSYASDTEEGYVRMGYVRRRSKRRLRNAKRQQGQAQRQQGQAQGQGQTQGYGSVSHRNAAHNNAAFSNDVIVPQMPSEAFRHGALTSEAGDLFLSSDAVEKVCQNDPEASTTVYAIIGQETFSPEGVVTSRENVYDYISQEDHADNVMTSQRAENHYVSMNAGGVAAIPPFSNGGNSLRPHVFDEEEEENLYESMDLRTEDASVGHTDARTSDAFVGRSSSEKAGEDVVVTSDEHTDMLTESEEPIYQNVGASQKD